MVPNCGDLTPCLSRKFARLGILVCDLYLTYHTEHILIFLAHYCNNRISVSNCILEASAQFLYNMYNSHNSIVQTCFMNALLWMLCYWFEDCYFRAKYRVNFITSTRSTIMSSIRVTVPTEVQTVSINNLFFLLSARSDLSFLEGFNLVEIIEMIDYVSTS